MTTGIVSDLLTRFTYDYNMLKFAKDTHGLRGMIDRAVM